MTSATSTTVTYDVIALAGGLLMACSQLPQIFRVIKRKSARDISYGFQLAYGTGAVMFIIYYGYYKIWSMFFPSLISLTFIAYMFGLKYSLEHKKGLGGERRVGGQQDSRLDRALLSEAS